MDFARGRLGGGIALETMTNAPLEPVLQEIVEEMRVLWPDRRIDTDFKLNKNILHDRNRMAQLFTNLLSNAMTHGRPETPVKVSAISDSAGFELSVANAAEPITPELMPRLFEPFLRGQSKNHRQGLGLGLYIASQIAKSHGGTLEASSTQEETRFTLRIKHQEMTNLTAMIPYR